MNRLNKTKEVREVDHEQERVDRIKKETAVRRAAAAAKVLFFFPNNSVASMRTFHRLILFSSSFVEKGGSRTG